MGSSRASVKSKASKNHRELLFNKHGHVYAFRYDNGQELALICTMLGWAMDPELNLDIEDARHLIDTLGLKAKLKEE